MNVCIEFNDQLFSAKSRNWNPCDDESVTGICFESVDALVIYTSEEIFRRHAFLCRANAANCLREGPDAWVGPGMGAA